MVATTHENAPFAFLLSCGAGAATALGAAVIYNTRLVKLANKSFLAGALGFSAGVMTYVSFTEVLTESIHGFVESGRTDADALMFTTICFFAGVALTQFLDYLVHHISHLNDKRKWADICRGDSEFVNEEELEHVQEMVVEAERVEMKEELPGKENHNRGVFRWLGSTTTTATTTADESGSKKKPDDMAAIPDETDHALNKTSLLAAIAIAMHNFPEGMATFMGGLVNLRIGGALAFAIAIHNIPEGIVVAVPVYYNTGNRRKAFLMAMVSGFAEPLGAAMCWLVLLPFFSVLANAVVLGIVAGIMVTLSMSEMYPTALRYDTGNKITFHSFVGGMVVMAISLVVFAHTEPE